MRVPFVVPQCVPVPDEGRPLTPQAPRASGGIPTCTFIRSALSDSPKPHRARAHPAQSINLSSEKEAAKVLFVLRVLDSARPNSFRDVPEYPQIFRCK